MDITVTGIAYAAFQSNTQSYSTDYEENPGRRLRNGALMKVTRLILEFKNPIQPETRGDSVESARAHDLAGIVDIECRVECPAVRVTGKGIQVEKRAIDPQERTAAPPRVVGIADHVIGIVYPICETLGAAQRAQSRRRARAM